MNYDFQKPIEFLEQITRLFLDKDCYRGLIVPEDLPSGHFAIGDINTDFHGCRILMVYMSELDFVRCESYFRAIAQVGNLPSQLSNHGYVNIGKGLYKPKFSFRRDSFVVSVEKAISLE